MRLCIRNYGFYVNCNDIYRGNALAIFMRSLLEFTIIDIKVGLISLVSIQLLHIYLSRLSCAADEFLAYSFCKDL